MTETKTAHHLDYIPANCYHCDEALLPGEKLLSLHQSDGKKTPVHFECFMRLLVGSAQHQLGECSCRLGLEGREEPAHLTKRQNARVALDTYYALLGQTPMDGVLL